MSNIAFGVVVALFILVNLLVFIAFSARMHRRLKGERAAQIMYGAIPLLQIIMAIALFWPGFPQRNNSIILLGLISGALLLISIMRSE